jgi:hypothetical protein
MEFLVVVIGLVVIGLFVHIDSLGDLSESGLNSFSESSEQFQLLLSGLGGLIVLGVD